MKALYGIAGGLAMVLLAGTAMAEARPVVASKILQGAVMPQVRTAHVTEASLTAPQVRVGGTVVSGTAAKVAAMQGPSLVDATKAVEGYFNGIGTLQAGFTQSVTGETTPSVGTFWWKRPRQFLWQYDTPVKQRIIGTGSAVYYIDQERNQVTQLPQNAGMARLFNAKTLNFAQQGLRATHVQSDSRMLAVTFAVDKKIATGDQTGLVSLKLVFDRLAGNNLQLRQIDAQDTLSVTTSVAFSKVQANVPVSAKMFAFTPGVYEQRN